MRIVSRVDVFLMCLWDEVKSKFLLIVILQNILYFEGTLSNSNVTTSNSLCFLFAGTSFPSFYFFLLKIIYLLQ